MKYRTRLTVIAAVCSAFTTGVILAALVFLVARSETEALSRDLQLGMGQAVWEIRELPKHPDFDEVVRQYPGLSVALADTSGHLLTQRGAHDFSRPVSDFPTLAKQFGDEKVIVGISGRDVHRRIKWLCWLAAAAWLCLSAAMALTISLAGRSIFAPLSAMAELTSDLDGLGLSFRLPLSYGGEYDQFAIRINELLARIERSSKKQQQFATDAAHELRTPLTIISGTLQELIADRRASPQQRMALDATLSEVERLGSLVTVLLESARDRRSESEAVAQVHGCIETSAARWLDRYLENDIALQVETVPAEVKMGRRELETVLDNLLANAMNASSPGCSVSISNRIEGRDNFIVVEDEGAGIPLAVSEEIFSRFVRIDEGRNRLAGGFGLGLSICRRLVEESGGQISVETEAAKGARFCIRLPAITSPFTDKSILIEAKEQVGYSERDIYE